jgi:hypothetical protein
LYSGLISWVWLSRIDFNFEEFFKRIAIRHQILVLIDLLLLLYLMIVCVEVKFLNFAFVTPLKLNNNIYLT